MRLDVKEAQRIYITIVIYIYIYSIYIYIHTYIHTINIYFVNMYIC